MSRTLELPVRSAIRSYRQTTQCLHQRSTYSSLDNPQTRLRPQWQPQTRPFSSTGRQRAMNTAKPLRPQTKQKAQPSMALAQKKQQQEMLRSGGLPDDMGILPGTLILPRNKDRWTWKLRKQWIRTRLTETWAALAYRWYVISPRPQLNLSKIGPEAKELHEQMYTAFAEGNLEPVANKVCSGLLGNLRGRIAQRAPNEHLDWTIVARRGSPRLVSYKAAVLPGPKEETSAERNGLVQAVVELRTVQRLQKMQKVQRRSKDHGLKTFVEPMPGHERAEEKESTEYVVVQKIIRKSKESEWKVWGFTEPTTLAKLESTKKR